MVSVWNRREGGTAHSLKEQQGHKIWQWLARTNQVLDSEWKSQLPLDPEPHLTLIATRQKATQQAH